MTDVLNLNMLEDKEQWQDIMLLPGYEASQAGRIRNKQSGRVLNPRLEDGAYYVSLPKVAVDALVAFTFNPVPIQIQEPTIIHVDGVRTNNHFLNLEYREGAPEREESATSHRERPHR